ncbi:MAG: DUF5686 and carboxypeptidase regulatory-like domain-containing protein [Flavobacteriales bacterium]|nr:DUF5686 and carboxypeptidase regulatory-like domain-containing protein [Flavobacteriales bacterium]
MRPLNPLLLSFLFLMPTIVSAFTVRGTVTDKEGLPVGFATVYVEGTTIGTTTNAEGSYQLELKQGYHVIVFRFVGYGTEVRPLTLNADSRLDVVMKRVIFELGEAVADGSEDPAYRVMRLAREKREFYRQQVQEYSCKVYVKGTNFVKNLPKRVLGRSIDVGGLDSTRSGIIYLSESVSEYHYKAPGKSKERVIASKVSGKSQGFTWNNATSLEFNFYDKMFSLEGLSNRDLVSPLSPSATLYYRFRYAGFYVEDSVIVNRIELLPRVKGVPLFKGFLFIQENTWRIHSADVLLTSESGIDYVDTVRLRANFVPITPDLWLKGTLTFDFAFNVKLLKVQGYGTFTSTFSDYSVRKYFRDRDYHEFLKNKKLQEAPAPAAARPKLADLLPKEPESGAQDSTTVHESAPEAAAVDGEFEEEGRVEGDATPFDFKSWDKGALIKVESEANAKGDAFWDSIRTIPLTAVEVNDYVRKDSIEQVMKTDAYKDSVDRKNNRFKIQDLLYGYTYSNSKQNWKLELQSPLMAVQFNTVEGYLIDHKLTFSKYREDKSAGLVASYWNRYGFATGRYFGKGSVFYRFNRLNRMRLSAEGGHYVNQFQNEAVADSWNSLYTVLFEMNYARLYAETYGKIGWGMEVFNGINLGVQLYYGERRNLVNATGLEGQYVNWDGRQFDANVPINGKYTFSNSRFGDNRAMKLRVSARFRPFQKYLEFPDRKINLGSKWPQFKMTYEWGIPEVGGSVSNYSYLQVDIDHSHSLGMGGKLEWAVDAGWFVFDRNVAFADFKHFYTSEIHIVPTGLNRFMALPYYLASTDDVYASAHLEHHFHGAILNKIPLIKKLKWQTVVGGHYLYEPNFGNYWEVTVGIENIFRIIRVDVAFPFREAQFQQIAFRVQLGL